MVARLSGAAGTVFEKLNFNPENLLGLADNQTFTPFYTRSPGLDWRCCAAFAARQLGVAYLAAPFEDVKNLGCSDDASRFAPSEALQASSCRRCGD